MLPSNSVSTTNGILNPSFQKLLISDLQALSQEARRSLPAVKDAAERVLLDIRRPNAFTLPNISTQVLHPFLFSCNYGDAPKKMLSLSLSCIQRFIVADSISTDDLPNLTRVLELQVCT